MSTRPIAALLSPFSLVGLFITLSGPGLGPPGAGAATDGFVRVKVDTANLRTGPSLEADSVRYAFENEPLRVVARQGEWLRVRDFEGHSAWIYASLTDRRPAVVVTRGIANVRARPGTSHPVVFTAERAVNLLVLDRTGRWLHVRHEVGEGWVHDSLVWGVP
jgi:SH3-like domain-containing protein